MSRPNAAAAFLLALAFAAVCGAQQTSLTLHPAATPVRIDGVVDDVWATADSTGDFIQHLPDYHKAPKHRTIAKVLATPDALYCLMLCYADPKTVQSPTGKLDEFGGDIVSIMLDTFGDKHSAYKFAVSAGGVRMDCRLLDDGRNRDYNWDGVWFSAARLYDWGFAIEMEIPWRSLQYDAALAQWGLDFDRWVPEGSEDLYWASYEENEGQRISKFGSLVLNGQKPTVRGLNLEVYPVGLMKASALGNERYHVEPDAGLDIFYNPSQSLTFQFTANPDFAQIEADPFQFSISRYETYFNERRPFFTQGNEVFMPSGRERNSGFYQPLEMFYSRRIGKRLPDGSEVPLLFGAKAFGRAGDWEYGGFVSETGGRDYTLDGATATEERATFASARVKRQVFENSTIGVLFVGKHDKNADHGVIDIDGAFRGSDWQLAYQLARSYARSTGASATGDYAASAGFKLGREKLFVAVRGRAIGNEFDIRQVGYVPWRGLSEIVGLAGPRWYFPEGPVRELLVYGGGALTYEHADLYLDRVALLGLNLQFRSNWGGEIGITGGRSKDANVEYDSYEYNASSWFNIDPKWSANLYGGWLEGYNFLRGYQSYYAWLGSGFSWTALDELQVGTSFSMYLEGDEQRRTGEITYNARPYASITPVNDLNLYAYVDLVTDRSSGKIGQLIGGLLFSYQFLPKSWVYFSFNQLKQRPTPLDPLTTRERGAVLKVKYLYYL